MFLLRRLRSVLNQDASKSVLYHTETKSNVHITGTNWVFGATSLWYVRKCKSNNMTVLFSL